jgi:hypothetical protein
LPVALLESSRDPDALSDALKIIIENAFPLELGIDEHDFGRRLHAIGRNIALVAPLADIIANTDWKGSAIVPRYLERMESQDQATADTTTIGKVLGHIPGVAPVQMDHLLNTYTGGLYRRLAGMFDIALDSSRVQLSRPSSIPVAGTLFLKAGTSEVIGEFYERQDMLIKKAGSAKATLEEIGELSESQKLSRTMSGIWRDRRDAFASDLKHSDATTIADNATEQIQGLIKDHNTPEAGQRRQRGIGVLLYAATSPKAEESDIEDARRLLSGSEKGERLSALRSIVKQRGGRLKARTSTGALTSFGKRLERLRAIDLDTP